jgi:hypothetical protein
MITDNLIKLPRPQGNASAYKHNTAHLNFSEILNLRIETAKNIARLRQELANQMWQQELLNDRFQEMIEAAPLKDVDVS